MPVSDPIGDMLTRMRNAQHARKDSCTFPHSRIKLAICEVLVREGYVSAAEVAGNEPKLEITVTFVPQKKLTVRRFSSPGRRSYLKAGDVRPVLSGFGMAVISTSQGLLTDREARERKIGGEILCTISA